MHHKLVKAVDLIAGTHLILIPGSRGDGNAPGLWFVRDKQWDADGSAIELKLDGDKSIVVEPDHSFYTVGEGARPYPPIPIAKVVNASEAERIRRNIGELEGLGYQVIPGINMIVKGTRP